MIVSNSIIDSYFNLVKISKVKQASKAEGNLQLEFFLCPPLTRHHSRISQQTHMHVHTHKVHAQNLLASSLLGCAGEEGNSSLKTEQELASSGSLLACQWPSSLQHKQL